MRFPFNPKLGIDNPALCLEEDPGTHPDPSARFCVLRKDASSSFGFHLCTELSREGHIVRQVIPGGPAHLAGLTNGDQVLQINGEYVHEQEHLRVVQKVKYSGNHVSLSVIDEAGYERLRDNDVPIQSILHNSLPESCPRPRLCLVRDEGRGFGFTTSITGGVRGTFLVMVEEGGAAEKAGVPTGARLFEVNGESVTSFTLSQLTKKLQSGGPRVVLLVLEASAWDVYESHRVTPSMALADVSFIPYRARKLHICRGSQGYGFLLRQEKCIGGLGQFLRELDPGLPAEDAGMCEGDRLLGVNGKIVEDLEHEDIVSLIQESGNQVTLFVISNEGDRFFSELGVSPLLFYEDQTCSNDAKESATKILPESKAIQVEETTSQPEAQKDTMPPTREE
ncbi:Na(+)/H(+) exchange regulatory cofactor NHE-RF4 isoform X2 [Hyperolius riggenbachi]|uniref:Na(+)/H(+) exchange regulatory cofactor NHE-RF4 isoform X2 n=1 Tax=Hyperolius riggenbachi TaxID=752182 RepID=UPI0035A2F094